MLAVTNSCEMFEMQRNAAYCSGRKWVLIRETV